MTLDTELVKLGKWTASQLRQDRDVVIVIGGMERSGKSSLSYWLGDVISFYAGTEFATENYVWQGIELVGKMWDLPERSVIVDDEAGLDLYKRESTSRHNRVINKALMISGLRNQCIILCVPSIWDLDKYISQRRGLVWIETKMHYKGSKIIRGHGVVRSHIESGTWDKPAYWQKEYDIYFPDMPYNFKQSYKKKKEAETKKRVEDMQDGVPIQNTAENLIKLALDVRERGKSSDKFTDQTLRDVLAGYGVKDKSYFYKVKKKHLQNTP